MARPKKPEHERKSTGTSEFFRRRALGYRMPRSGIEQQKMAELTTALLRIGVNLNQIAHHVNAGRSTPVVELSDLIARINATMDALDESGGAGQGPEL